MAFAGLHRKLSIFPIVLLAVGWVVYLIGSVRYLEKDSPSSSMWEHYPAIVAIIFGPLFFLASLLQSYIDGTPSAVMGSLAATSATIFLVTIGDSTISSAQILYKYNNTAEEIAISYPASALTGSVLCTMAITILLALWGYYEAKPPSGRSGDGRQQHNTSASNPSLESATTLFAGYARRLAVMCILLAGVGWGVLVGGHHQRINRIPSEGGYINNLFFFDFGIWGTLVLSPLLLFFALIHTGSSGRTSSAIGVVTSILNSFVLTSLGFYMVHDVGGWLREECKKKCDFSVPQDAAALCEILGSFVFFFFWTCVVSTWPFFRNEVTAVSTDGRGAYTRVGSAMKHIDSKTQSTTVKPDQEDLEPL